MAGQKFLVLNAGEPEEAAAVQASAGAADAGKVPGLDAAGKLDLSMMPTGVSPAVETIPASEALAGGDWVNVYDDIGTRKVRKADATSTGKPANGFVKAAVESGANATVYADGTNDQLSGLTPGAAYYLSATAGGEVAEAPSGSGNVVQRLGTAMSATAISFHPGPAYKLA